MRSPRSRMTVSLAAVAATAVGPAIGWQAASRPEPAVLAWCYEVTVDTGSWEPSFEVCNLPEIGQGGVLD